MLLKPQPLDLKIVGYYLGRITLGLAFTVCLPLGVALLFGELNPALDFIISFLLTLLVGLGLVIFCRTDKEPRWMHGMLIVSLVWFLAMLLGAIPLYLSGHYRSFLDACFEAMSGFATTGLTLVQELEHLSYTHNFWRHLIMFIGGQGIVIVALAFFVKGATVAFKMYTAEAREEKILPNIISTARVIWVISLTYLILGTALFTLVGLKEGLGLANSLFHGLCLFMAGFDTGGFSLRSQNILYYHSFYYEILTIIFMVLGAINFRLHYAIWSGNRKELWRNLETITFCFTLCFSFMIVSLGLRLEGLYPNFVLFFRRGFYQLISAHTGTGYTNLYAFNLAKNWSPLALLGIMLAMAIGGSSCSTTGAIKTLRVGLFWKGLKQEIKRLILPEATVVLEKFHHIKDTLLEDKHLRSALLISLSYIFIYLFGALVGVYFKYPFLEALFESTSAAANVPTFVGITQHSMPDILKIIYIFQMWAGRLEFLSVFTLFGFFWAFIRGR